ncbi:ubiquitin carboxyl-terminal hydrolase 4 [Elysia marginata]|uniref:ubiquitinyl hydrolase 1 n=1 Tax=Elysia marginata TaxID=1093978 RepID=A0AAV4FF19_9GAST|nr:ubiquitin carboxyl-terminal hydrolase 4 [Elysia marginata]
MEVSSSSQAESSSPLMHHGALGSSQTLSQSGDDEAAGGEEGGDGMSQNDNQFGHSSGRYTQHHNLSLAVAVPSSSLTVGIVSPLPGADGDNLNNAADVGGGTSMELVRYGPAFPPFYSSESMNYSKDIRDSKAVHGSCGLYNLGNTCFMNAGLQSLMSCAPLVKFFCEGYAVSDNNRHTLTAHFHLLLCKIWSGKFSVVHPRKFKDFLGMYHSQFEDYRQHDCQEFLALLLDTLHEQLNKATAMLFPSLSSPRPPALADTEAGSSSRHGSSEAEQGTCNSSITLNNKEQMEEETGCGSNQTEAVVLPEQERSLSGDKDSSVVASSVKFDAELEHPEHSPVSPLSEDSPTSEVSMLESVMTSPASQADSASSSKSPDRSQVVNMAEKASVITEEEDEAITSSFPTLQRHSSRSHLDDVSSSDLGVLPVKPSLKRVSSGSSMSTSCCQLVLHSEDSNHSSLSAHSTDSEQSSAFKRLKIEAADMGKNLSSNNSSNLKECVTSSSDCSKKLPGSGRDKKTSILGDQGDGARVKGKILREADGGDVNVDMSPPHDLAVIDNMVTSCQNLPVCSSGLAPHNEAQAVCQLPRQEADSASAATQKSIPPLNLSCLDDFYSKETKTLNTNVQVSEFLQEITADSEKFAKLDNRNRPPSKEVNILQEASGEENKTEKVLIGETLGSGVKENNLYVQTSNVSVVKPCKSGELNVVHNSLGEAPLPTEESSKLSCVCRPREGSTVDKDIDSGVLLKSADSCLVAVTSNSGSGFKFDEEEKNVQMQAYSKFNTVPVHSNIRVDLSNTLADTDSMEVDEVLESSDEDDLELEPPSHTSTVEACSSVPNSLRHNCPVSEVKMATSAWEEYHARNDSVVVNTFQGQFRSTVVCSECSHVSVTYEPFMYLSLPIPHAMDQQICVTYISEHKPPVKYLLNLLKTDKVSAAKHQLNQLLGKAADEDMVVAEVLDSHISRILVVCSECSHVSVTYEPFMYLSLPIPHAMDQQICVTYISEHKPPVKYLLNLLKTDKVSAAKHQLNQLLGKAADEDMVVAEVLDSHISRILDNNVLLKYVNTFNRKIYAFEIITSTPSSFEVLNGSPDGPEDHAPTPGGSESLGGTSPSRLRLGSGVTRDCPETSNQSFDSVMVNSPGSRDALEGMLSDSEGCEAEFLSFSNSTQAGRQAQVPPAVSARTPVDSGDGDVSQCLPSSSAEMLQDNTWFMGDCVGVSRLPCTYDEDYDKENDEVNEDTLLNKDCADSLALESGSSKISSSSPLLEARSPNNSVKDDPHKPSLSSRSKFWIDEDEEKMRMVAGVDGDNEADAGLALTDQQHINEAEDSGNVDISTTDTSGLWLNQFQASSASPSSLVPLSTSAMTSSTTVVSSSSSSNKSHAYQQLSRDEVSSSEGGCTSSPLHSPSHSPSCTDLEISMSCGNQKNGGGFSNTVTSCSGSGHLSRSCPSPTKLFSEVRGQQEEEATLLGAAAKLGENPGSYFLKSKRMRDYEEEDFYSDQGDGSTYKEESNQTDRSSGQKKLERECEGPDWANTFPVHNFSSSTVQPTAYGSDQWKSCAICLEDLLDSELLTHVMCDGVFCQNCLEMSVKHTADMSAFCCPGLRCSRCPYSAHCTGCQVTREACEVSLQPSDCLTVHVGHELTADQLTDLQLVHDDVTMAGLRSSEPTTIMDCFGAFTQSELLDEHNPWFCPRCERNQCAKKTMTVWRYPDNLIIHLKRFVYQDLSSTKVDAKVVFPQEGMDVRGFLSGPSTAGLLYDLHSIVCHMGGASAGHYTCYARHPVTHQWYYYNDENVSAQDPGETEFTSGYVLFYQRQGTDVEFTIPENNPCLEDDLSDVGGSLVSSGTAIPLGPPTSSASSGFPFSYSGSKNTTTTGSSPAGDKDKQQQTTAALPSSSISGPPDGGNDDEDDYDNEQRLLPYDDGDDDTALTVHFGSSFPTVGQVSSAHNDSEDLTGEVSGDVEEDNNASSYSDRPSHSYAEPDSTLSFM